MDGWQDEWRDGWMERTTTQGYYISKLVGTCDLRTLWSPPISLNQDKHTKAQSKLILFLFYLFFVTKIRWKVPHENIHGEASILGNFPKKNLNRQEGKKKSFEITTFWEEKKQVLKSLRFVEDLGKFQAFFFWNAFMKGLLTLTPLPPRRMT